MTIRPRAAILDIHIDAQTFDQALSVMTSWAVEPDGRRYVCTCPAYTLMLCHEIPALREAIGAADMVTADGMPIVWVQHQWGFSHAERVYGPDVMGELCRRTAAQNCSHFFLGGTPGVANQLIQVLTTKSPSLQIAGVYSGSADIDTLDWALIDHLNAVQPNIIWVGLGSPKQDIWMHRYRSHLNAPLMIGVGAAFDFLSGNKPQAPRWMQRNGLEWVFRLAHEPRRLWRRYLVYNPRFVAAVLRQHLTQHS